MKENPRAEIQLYYARVIDLASKIGFLFLLGTFFAYISGLLTPYVPLADLPRYWGLSAHQYLEATGIGTGWTWLGELHHGDFLNFLPIAILSGVTILGYLAVLGKFFRQREPVLGVIIIVQILILVLAASGILKTGGH